MSVGLLDGVSDAHNTCDWSRYATKHIQEGTFRVDFRHSLVEHSCRLESESSCHLFSLENLARELGIAYRASFAMRLGVSVGRVATREIPPLHCASSALADRCSLDIDPLADPEMARTKAVANR